MFPRFPARISDMRNRFSALSFCDTVDPVHTTPEEFENGDFTGFVFEENSAKLHDYRQPRAQGLSSYRLGNEVGFS